jgi:hypothetical protein
MRDHDPIFSEQFSRFGKEAWIVRRAEMLDQPNVNDAFERSRHVAIIGKGEAHPICYAFGLCVLLAERDLIRRESDAEHVDVVMTVEVEREAAPAAADIEDPHAGL